MDGLENVTVPELEAALTEAHAQMKVLKARKRAIARVLEAKAVDVAAQERVSRMSDPEKAALRAALAQDVGGAGGIASGEAVGEPGR